MTTEIMESCDCDIVLTKVLSDVSNTSKEVVHIRYTEESSNKFLDYIIDLKQRLVETSAALNNITNDLEESTWQKCTNPELLALWKNIFASCKDLRIKLIKKYIFLNKFRSKGIAVAEIAAFKHSIDIFTETYSDVEFIVFELPEDKRYSEVTKKLEDFNGYSLLA